MSPDEKMAGSVATDPVPCLQGMERSGSGLMRFPANGAAGQATVPAQFAAVQARYGLLWPDASVLVPSVGPAMIVLSRQRGEMQVLARETAAVLRVISLRDRNGRSLSYAGALESVSRRSVLIRFEEAELWELFLTADAPAIYEGLVHDFRMGEGLREPQLFPVRRMSLDAPVIEMMSEPGSANLLLVQTDADGKGRLVRFNLDVRRQIGQIQTRSPLGRISLVSAGDRDWVLMEYSGEIADAYRLPDLLHHDWRQVQSGKCRAP